MHRRRTGSEVIPSARRLIGSLRDLGYDLAAAIADLVDNSLEAEAENVWIDLHFDGDDSWLRIADECHGRPAVPHPAPPAEHGILEGGNLQRYVRAPENGHCPGS